MSRGNHAGPWRPLAVWAAVTVAATGSVAGTPGAWRAARSAEGGGDFADVLVAVCACLLALALTWLWVVTTTTVGGLLAGRPRVGGGATRRVVLAACGAAVLAGTGAAASASSGDGSEVLVGLALPDRAVAPAHAAALRPAAPTRAAGATDYVVRPGDSLWSIAADHPGSGSTDERWRAIWRANRSVVGDDPDVILPGQALRLPAPTPKPDTQDGDR